MPLAVTTTVLISAGVTVLLLLLFEVGRRLSRRSEASAEMRISSVVDELTARMEAMSRDLTDALERAREESRRNRLLGELAGSIDLDEVLNRTLDAAGALPGADAALIDVTGPEGEPIVAALGLSQEETDDHAVGRPPRGRRIRSLEIDYDASPDPLPGDAVSITGGLAVPIRGEAGQVGLLSIFTRAEQPSFGEAERQELEALALRAGPAIENARSFREARQLADLDALTGLHNRRYFHETLAREVARAQRYNRHLALVVFDLDDFKAINDQIGHLAGDSVLAEVAERVREVVRSADIACRVGGDEFAVVLPESALDDADQLYRRMQTAVSAKPIAQAGRLRISAGVAELKPGDDATSFFQRADEALYRAKEAGKGQSAAAPDVAAFPNVSELQREEG